MTEQYLTQSAEQTENLGTAFAKRLRPGDAVALFGGLGAGKTAFVRGLAAGLRYANLENVSSPTYALVHEYTGPLPLAHFDMYRVDGLQDLESTGYYDYLNGAFILAIEWSERILDALPENCWLIHFEMPKNQPNCRIITISRGEL